MRLLAGLVVGLVLWPAVALADGTPVRVVLAYQNGLSNWGPPEASGVIELVRAEGEARLTARGLPPTPGLSYVVWLTRDDRPDLFFRLGTLRTRPDGIATLDQILPDPIPDRGWTLVLITAESMPTAEQPGPRRSIAGRILAPTPFGPVPQELPNTGAGQPAPPIEGSVVALAVAAALLPLRGYWRS